VNAKCSVGPSNVHEVLVEAAKKEFEFFSTKKDILSTSLRFDLHLAENAISHLRLDIDMDTNTRKPMAWKLTGPRHRAAELNTFVVQTYYFTSFFG
jgi:hypothetical protein